MNTETKTIDVLAVMFAASVKMSGVEDDDLMKARAAVVELIEAAKPFAALLQENAVHSQQNGADSLPVYAINGAKITLGDLRRLVAVLAAVGGAK